MSYTAVMAQISPCFSGAKQERQPSKKTQLSKPATTTINGFGGKKKDPVWQCVQNCGACCKLDKGPSFPSPEEIFDDPSDVQLYESLIGPDGWCVNYDKSTRKCSVYADRPYFCRVEPEIFDLLYGIDKKKFNKEACSSNGDTGPSGELLSYSQEGLYEDSNLYEEIDDYYSRSWYANGSSDQEYKDIDMAYSGSGNWLRDCESYFGAYWGEDEVYSDKGYEAYGNSLEKEESPGQEQRYGIYDSSNDDMKQDYNENQWLGYGGFGFGSDGIEDFHGHRSRDFHYNSSWDDLEEVILYERIFGDWHCPLTLDN